MWVCVPWTSHLAWVFRLFSEFASKIILQEITFCVWFCALLKMKLYRNFLEIVESKSKVCLVVLVTAKFLSIGVVRYCPSTSIVGEEGNSCTILLAECVADLLNFCRFNRWEIVSQYSVNLLKEVGHLFMYKGHLFIHFPNS